MDKKINAKTKPINPTNPFLREEEPPVVSSVGGVGTGVGSGVGAGVGSGVGGVGAGVGAGVYKLFCD